MRTYGRIGLVVTGVGGAVACAASAKTDDQSHASTTGDGGAPLVLALACTDDEQSVFGDPGADFASKAKGAIFRCGVHETLTAKQIDGRLQDPARAGDNAACHPPGSERPIEPAVPGVPTFSGRAAKSGSRVLRVLYRTERGDEAGTPGYSSAVVFVPDGPVSAKTPVVALGRGSRGQTGKCAIYRNEQDDCVLGDVDAIALAFAGQGFVVVASDFAGYANFGAAGNPMAVYANVADEGKSLLDSVRAVRQLLPAGLTDKVAVVGHSQGGHAALAALATAESYGMADEIGGVVAFAPLWMSQRVWGAYFLVGDEQALGKSAAVPVSIWYHYTHGELLDGPGGGLAMFKPEKRDAVKKFVDGSCWQVDYPDLVTTGRLGADYFDEAFVGAVTASAAFNSAPCPTSEPAASTCKKWLKRYFASRPTLTGAASNIPLLVAYGGKDTSLAPNHMRCALDSLEKRGTPVEQCFDPEAGHTTEAGIVRLHSDYALDWVANRLLGTEIKASCPSNKIDLRDANGQPVTCRVPPDNEDPTDL